MPYNDRIEKAIKNFYKRLENTYQYYENDYFNINTTPDGNITSILDLPIFKMLLDVKLSEHKKEWKNIFVYIDYGLNKKLMKYIFNQMYDYINKNRFEIIMTFNKYRTDESEEILNKLIYYSSNLKMLNSMYYQTIKS